MTTKQFLQPLTQYKRLSFMQCMTWIIPDIHNIAMIALTAEIFGAIQNGDTAQVTYYAYIFLWSVVFRLLWQFFTKNIQHTFHNNIMKEMDRFSVQTFLRLPHNTTESLWYGRLTNILWYGSNGRQELLVFLTHGLIPTIVSIALSLIYIFSLWTTLGLFACLWIVITVSLFFITHKPLKKVRKRRKENGIKYDREYTRIFMSKMEIIQNDTAKKETKNLIQRIDLFIKDLNIQATYGYFLYKIPDSLLDIIRWWALLFLWVLIINGESNLQILSGLLWALGYLSSLINNLTQSHSWINQQYIEYEKISDLIKENTFVDYHAWSPFVYKKWVIQCENISFGYEKERNIFKDLSLTITWWSKIALVWPSWWWKTTLVKILTGSLTPTHWSVFVDGQNLSQTNLASYYAHIWYLTQDPQIFDGTIHQNMIYSTPDATEKEISDALVRAHCDFVFDLSAWVQTEIGEKGIKLSWWQRQRLAIAKLFLKNPSIVILDEPTSALDSMAEDVITQSLDELFVWRTVIIIAHRLQTTRQADRILYIENWVIVEEWSHTDLVSLGGKYKRMLELQSTF